MTKADAQQVAAQMLCMASTLKSLFLSRHAAAIQKGIAVEMTKKVRKLVRTKYIAISCTEACGQRGNISSLMSIDEQTIELHIGVSGVCT